MSTWFKVHRAVFDSDLWHDVTTFRLFLFLIGKATHQDGVKVAGVELKRGQYLRSYRKLAEDLAYKEGRGRKEYSTRTIKNAIDKLIADGRVSKQETEQGTLFTILNYAEYQGFQDNEKRTVNGSVNEEETFGKRSVNNNKNEKNAISTTSTKGPGDSVDVIAERFSDLRSAREGQIVYPRIPDYDAIKMTLERVPEESILVLLEQCFQEYASKNGNDPTKKISSFKYCMTYIVDHYEREIAKAGAQKAASNVRQFKPKDSVPEYNYGF